MESSGGHSSEVVSIEDLWPSKPVQDPQPVNKQQGPKHSFAAAARKGAGKTTKTTNRGAAAKAAIDASKAEFESKKSAGRVAKMEKKLGDMSANLENAVAALKAVQEPYEQAINLIQNRAEQLNALLAERPLLGFSGVDGLIKYIDSLKMIDAKESISGFKNLLMTYIGGSTNELPGHYVDALPSDYWEKMTVVVYNKDNKHLRKYSAFVLATTFLATLRLAVTPVNSAQQVLPRVFQALNNKFAIAGAVVAAGLYVASNKVVPYLRPIYVHHQFSYAPLPAEEQRDLSRDRRNMSLRAATVLESSFGLRVKHNTSLFFDEYDVSAVDDILAGTIMAPAAAALQAILGTYAWFHAPPTRRLYDPVPLGTVVWNRQSDRALEVAAGLTAEDIRNRLLSTVPNVDGSVIDFTLFHWQAQNPAFMEFQQGWAKKYNDVRQALSVCGSVAHDLRPAQYQALYPATTVVTMVKWLELKTRIGAVCLPCQEWLF